MVEHTKKSDDVELVTESDGLASEDLELEDEEQKKSDKLRSLKDALKVCETDKTKILEDLQRTRADFLNSKRRLEEQFERDKERIVDTVVRDMLPLIDSFETALLQRDDGGGGHWQKGVEAMRTQFLSILKSYNISEIETEGKPFDPHEHDAVTSRQAEHGEPPDTVLEVLQKGYRRGEIVIRPAKVVIAA